jgi:transposase
MAVEQGEPTMTKVQRARKVYSEEFVAQAVALSRQPGASVTGTARSLGVPQKTLDGWVKRAEGRQRAGEDGCDDPVVLRVRLKEAEARIRRLETEKEILKKATAYFASQSP